MGSKHNLVTDRTKRTHPAHTHEGIVPRGGGVAIFIAILLVTVLFLPLKQNYDRHFDFQLSLYLLWVYWMTVMTSPYLRFGANILISAIVIGFGLGIPFVSNPFGGVVWS